ncbi:hypothetical protein Dsin_028194 [Dipteronia sinensis]|uniref:RRM domain-containing protein n=1 Tax=Dipteronia sinensis TaxID=43782 RepID=A0AAE0DU10_9ROSI|nr:hypothetical protein Dsin_028194 [Dipteronia sinensis]
MIGQVMMSKIKLQISIEGIQQGRRDMWTELGGSLKEKARENIKMRMSFKGKYRRQHPNIDRRRVTSNGSSGHYGRHGGSISGLGGYSPRKRKTEAAAKTPPINRSPEKKSAKWDVAPVEKDGSFASSVPSNVQTSNQTTSSNVLEVVSSTPVTSIAVNSLTGVSYSASWTKQNVSVDSVQLTQATWPMRRLYVENVPASASEKAVMEFLNTILLSSGANYVHGSLTCISCNEEKGQALVEFLTPEDASAALSCVAVPSLAAFSESGIQKTLLMWQ